MIPIWATVSESLWFLLVLVLSAASVCVPQLRVSVHVSYCYLSSLFYFEDSFSNVSCFGFTSCFCFPLRFLLIIFSYIYSPIVCPMLCLCSLLFSRLLAVSLPLAPCSFAALSWILVYPFKLDSARGFDRPLNAPCLLLSLPPVSCFWVLSPILYEKIQTYLTFVSVVAV